MKTIHKYLLKFDETGRTNVSLPAGAQILSLKFQNEAHPTNHDHGDPMLWALVDPAETKNETRNFRFTGTGHPIENPDKLRYITTALQGRLVWHFFEEAA